MRALLVKHARARYAAGAFIMLLAALALPSSFSVRVPAILRASADAQIFPPIPSEIVKVNVKEGEFVTKGQLLFQMRSPQLEKESGLSKRKIEALTLTAFASAGRSGRSLFKHRS